MNFFILLVYFVVNAICISLHLPSNDRESPILNIVQEVEYSHIPFHPSSLIHFTITYESKTDDLINEVYYHGAKIFHDEGHDPQPERRIVTYTSTGRNIIISIHPDDIDKNNENNFFEAQFYIEHEGIYDVAHNVPSGIHIVKNNVNAVKEHELMAFLNKKDLEDELMPIFPSFNIIDFVASRLFRGRFRRATATEENELYEKTGMTEDDYQLRGNNDEEEGVHPEQLELSENQDRLEPEHQQQPFDASKAIDAVQAESSIIDTTQNPKSNLL